MTTELRTSQVEVLKRVRAHGEAGAELVGFELRLTRQSAEGRLDRLANRGLLELRRRPLNSPAYRLTQLGHEALEGSDG